MRYHIDLDLHPASDDLLRVRDGLIAYNLAQEPRIADLPRRAFNVICKDGTRLLGGAACALSWGYLYVDTLWVDAAERGRGLGTAIMQAAATYAVHNATPRAYLITTSFQARPLYEKVGYQVAGAVADFPAGHTLYYMVNNPLQASAPDPRLTLQVPANASDTQYLEAGLLRHADASGAALTFDPLAVFLRDETGAIRGGVTGVIYWNWFEMKRVWVADDLRGQGWGSRLLEHTITHIRKRNLTGITANTASFQALPFYQRHGFEVVMTLPDRPPQHHSTYIVKYL